MNPEGTKVNAPTCSRRFEWMSSTNGDATALERLAAQMASFYADPAERSPYQEMLADPGNQGDEASIRVSLPRYVSELAPNAVLEVGCADGRQYRELRAAGFSGAYAGIEVAADVIERDRQEFPTCRWETASAYALPFGDAEFDVCFSMFVLEHLVYPERGLREMLRVLRPGGRLLLVFPDFVVKKQLNSQQLGFSATARASQKLRQGRVLDAFVSLYDSRVRLPRALRQMPTRVGPFPINARPIALTHRELMRPDIDAVYIASKEEVAAWARARGCTVEYPFGASGYYADIAFMSIRKIGA